ncbi:MAG: hypothetical protein Q7S34_00630 [bacterium]|nr:hypothetical protein [bacterium]
MILKKLKIKKKLEIKKVKKVKKVRRIRRRRKEEIAGSTGVRTKVRDKNIRYMTVAPLELSYGGRKCLGSFGNKGVKIMHRQNDFAISTDDILYRVIIINNLFNMNSKEKLLQYTKTAILAIALVVGLSYLQAWTGPLSSPPTCTPGNPGCDAPINVSATTQTKTGPIGATDFVASNSLTAMGNVGLGTVSPSARLHTIGSSATNMILDNSAGGNNWFQIRSGAVSKGYFGYLSTGSAGLAFLNAAGSGEANMLITDAGNVGIGTVSPAQKLDVAGNIKGTQLCIGADCRNAWPAGATGETHGKQKFTSSGSFTVPTGVTTVWVSMSGGGGGGGGNYAFYAGGGGGGADAVLAQQLTVTSNATYGVTVGNGGAGGLARSGAPGGTGGSSNFGGLLAVAGGVGGVGGSSGGEAGGSGGSRGTDPFLANYDHTILNPAFYSGGNGGGSIFGAGGAAGTYATAGSSGSGYGGGGGGAGSGQASVPNIDGAPGAPGFVLVEW